MQFTTITIALAAAMSAVATPLEARQAGSIRAQFYTRGGCEAGSETGVVTTIFQGAQGECRDFTAPPGQQATYFDQRTLTRTIRLYNRPCSDKGSAQYLEISPTSSNVPDCLAQQILSYETL